MIAGDIFYMIVITYFFMLISLLLNVFYHKLSPKQYISSLILQIFVMNSAVLFMLDDMIEPKILVMWQIPVMLIIFILSQVFDRESLKLLNYTQNRIVLSLIFIYVAMSILKFNTYFKNFLYFVIFALAELFVFGILQKAYTNTRVMMKERKEEKKREEKEDEEYKVEVDFDNKEQNIEKETTSSYVDFDIDEDSVAKNKEMKIAKDDDISEEIVDIEAEEVKMEDVEKDSKEEMEKEENDSEKKQDDKDA